MWEYNISETLLAKKKLVTSYPVLNLIRLLTLIVYLIVFYFFLEMKFHCNCADLFNFSFVPSIFPSVLKTPKVVPVFKKDSKLDYSNYRPISLLFNIEKILEELMYRRLYTFLNNNNIIQNLQSGFRQHYSTSYAIINITENIRIALDEWNIGCGVFVDIQKAFDTVEHQVLLAKLNHGICGVSNDWFK